MKREKLRHYANVISVHADAPWVTALWFGLFFIDSFLLFIPVDTLMAATLAMKPQHRVRWITWGLVGFGLGLGMVAILVNSQLQPWFFEQINHWGYVAHVQDVVSHAQSYGYLELTLGVYTVLPSLFGVLAGVLVHLNPWVVWAISFSGKVLKLLLTVWVVFGGHQTVKRWIKLYLKTSV